MSDRAKGALLGLAVGDALGTTYEFRAIEQPDYPTLATGPANGVVGGGPFELRAGQVTDDTQLAVCLARSLHERGGLDVDDLGRRYVAWAQHAFDIGAQTRAAIDRLEDGEPAAVAGIRVWHNSDRRPAGNGSLMRTAPIGVAYAAREPAALVDAAIADSLITHADPKCTIACAAFDAAIAAAIRTGCDAAGMLDAAHGGVQAATERLHAAWTDPIDRERIARAHEDLTGDLAIARGDTPSVYEIVLHLHRTQGFVRVAFRLAFWHLLHTRSWHDALIDVASRGGDADTNGAIVGALLGARDGATAIPDEWVQRVLGATQPGPDDWAEAHHPRHLLALVA
ncbi:MAG TPA: ADP-ribosylglycohydrolase family protein [Kofleriaceae bacterium]|nr:ADP-ribosylglycohydrolase family protein [Kofleriaceae bacterium]